jgi:NAD(P)H-dependent FMN reductase
MQLAKTIQERFKDQFDLHIPDLRVLPYFDQDEEYDPPEVVRQFKQTIKEADGILIIMPEYNWSVPGVLKNAIDWLSRVDKVMIGKPVMTAGVSPGMMGTIRAQLHIRQILASPGIQAKLLPPAGNEIIINFAAEKFEAGRLVDEPTLQFVDEVITRFIDFVQS